MYYGYENEAPIKLKDCYRKCIELAEEFRINNNMEQVSIGFPCISTGIYGYPKDEACKIAIDTIKECSNERINPKGGRVIHITPEQLDRLYSYEIESETKGRS